MMFRMRTVIVKVPVGHRMTDWTVPFGFGSEYKRRADEPASPEVLRDILELVGYTAEPNDIKGWSIRERVEAEVYAVREHLVAGDNPLQRHPRPSWFGEPWSGGVGGGNIPTRVMTPTEQAERLAGIWNPEASFKREWAQGALYAEEPRPLVSPPTTPNLTRLRAINGALIDAPAFERHHRGTNWLAVIDVDPILPGGLARTFQPYGKGDCLYVLHNVELFNPVEFGADYTTTLGRKHRLRWYGVVVSKTDTFVELEQHPTGIDAVLRSRALTGQPQA